MKQSILRLLGVSLLASALALAAGCGGDTVAPVQDGGGVAADGGGQAADGGGVRTDGGPRADGGQDAGPPGLSEGEGPNERTNDTLDTAKAINVGDTIDGTIGTPVTVGADVTDDVDVFKFNATAGDVLRITLRQLTDYAPVVIIRNRAGDYSRALTALGSETSATRQFYIPTTGEYFLQILDLRNTGQTPEDVGGAGNTYRFTLVKETVTPTAVTVPVTARAGAISADQGVQIFGFNVASVGLGVSSEVRSGRLNPPSDVDTILYLVDTTTTPLTVLSVNDDLDAQNQIYDSKVRAIAAHAGAHQVILDPYMVSGSNLNFELDLVTFDSGVEQEPNDGQDVANSLATPVTGTPVTVTGAINKRDASTDGGTVLGKDLDFFQFEAVANTYYEITVTKPGGSNAAFVPYLAFLDPSGNVTFSNPNKPANQTVRLEAFAFEAGPHYVALTDARNLVSGSAAAGGTDYTYSIRVAVITRTVTPLGNAPITASAQSKIDLGGKTAWFSFVVPAGNSKQFSLDLDLGTAAGASGAGLNPWVTLFGTDGITPIAGGNSPYIPDTTLEAGTYLLTVADFDGAFSDTLNAFKARIVATGEFTPVVDDASHTTRAAALAVTGNLAVVSSTLAAGGQNWVALGSLTANSGVSLITAAGPAGAVVDTKITLVNSAGTDVPGGSNDDVGFSGADLFARLLGFKIPTTDTYFLRIDGGTTTAAGAYKLFVQKGVCVGAAAPAISVNEIFANPGTTAGDANGDGSTNAVSDEFVELLNSGRAAADLSGVIVRDLSGARARFACGTSIDAGKSLSIFGACASNTCVAGKAQSNVTPDAPATVVATGPGLGLDDTGDVVFVLSRTGAVIDRVVYGAATAGTAFARGAGGVCDVRPVAGTSAVQLHTACTGAGSRAFSPGKKADGTDFTAPPPLTNDTCALATPLTAGVTLAGQDTSTFANDYDPGTATAGAVCEYPLGVDAYVGKDAAFSITIPAGKLLTVLVTPVGSWDPGVAIVTDCAAASTSCKAVMDDGGNGTAETVTYRNTGGSSLPVFVLVDSYSATSFGEFSIRATIDN